MKISAKGRYGLAAMTYLAMHHAAGLPITILNMAERLGLSKIYLEQVFSLLKRAKLVLSLKGSQGGYRLARSPKEISAYEILGALEGSLLEKTSATVKEKAPAIDRALDKRVFAVLDHAVADALNGQTLSDLVNETEHQENPDQLMYFI